MLNIEKAKALALSLPEAVEAPHFENISFRVKKKIFVTLNTKEERACVKLSEIDQSVFSAFDSSIIYPVPNKWGKQGWTLINLKKVRKDIFMDALTLSYCLVAPKILVEKVRKA